MDIVVTIPRNEYKNDDKETEYLKNNPDAYQFWTLGKIPRKLNIGDRVYFVKNNKIESSMRVFDIKINVISKCEVTGRYWYSPCQLYMDDLRVENIDIPVRGFQNFRYKWWEG